MADMNKEEQSMERLLMVIKVKPEMRSEERRVGKES